MVNFSFATGLVTVFLMLFVSSNVIRSFGWTIAALVTPVVLLVTGAGFFGFILGQKALATTLQGVAMTPLAMGWSHISPPMTHCTGALMRCQQLLASSSRYSTGLTILWRGSAR